jgi:hypothetical protein
MLWVCQKIPEREHPVVAHDQSRETKTSVVMFVLCALVLLMFLLVYALVRPQKQTMSRKGEKESLEIGSIRVQASIVDTESRAAKSVPNRKVPGSPHSRCHADDDGFASCDEDWEANLPGALSIVGFLVDKKKLSCHKGDQNYEALVQEVYRRCSLVDKISMDQALRFSLGLNFDAATAADKWHETCAWREQNRMARETSRCVRLQFPSSTEIVSFPHEDEIYNKAFLVRPCSLVTRTGEPVSIWHAGTGSSSASTVSLEKVEEWARSVFEYADVWAKAQSQAAGQLLGQIQVFDMSGVGVRQIANRALHERFKCALGCGGNYVELVSHIYVINSSWVFSKVWNIVKPLISPRTASKVTVATGVPPELLDLLTADSARMLPEMLQVSSRTETFFVQRPPGQRHDCV